MGKEKLLLPLGDRPVIVRCITALCEAGVHDIIVVTRLDGVAIRNLTDQCPVRQVINQDPASDMAGSVRAGLRVTGTDVVLVFPADFPLVAPATIKELVSVPGSGILIPRYRGKGGHPVLFPGKLLEEINTVPTLMTLIARHRDKVRYVDVPDRGILLDLDTPEDYRQMCEAFPNEFRY